MRCEGKMIAPSSAEGNKKGLFSTVSYLKNGKRARGGKRGERSVRGFSGKVSSLHSPEKLV